ncbi:MAG TPA: PQQ-binding-like beta-propeller repeat protein, partial [Pirellulales bacterium]|nr:PQQ-binding-like beta-propeller repeat protein [Pirellulales bacterium]
MFRIALATIIGLSSSAQAADWPNWRGPRHDGISRETDWTSDWMASEPKELWGVGVGTGFSSLAISDGRAFTAGHNDGQDTVFCLNAETGKLKWKHSYPAPLVDNLHEGGPAATPTVDEGRVYTLSKDGQLFAFDAAKGEVLWQAHIGELADVVMPEWGFSCSALVVGDMLILDAGSTIALDKHNGKLVWKTERYRPGYGSATPCTFDGQSCVAVLNNDALILVRTSDGAVLASHPWQTNYATTSTTPIVQGDDIFISSGYQRGCALLRRNDEKFDVVYENRNMSNHMATCVLHEGHLYGIDGNSHNA